MELVSQATLLKFTFGFILFITGSFNSSVKVFPKDTVKIQNHHHAIPSLLIDFIIFLMEGSLHLVSDFNIREHTFVST